MRGFVVACTLMTFATPARADRASDLVDEAFAAAGKKDWETARAKFEQAYAIDRSPKTLYNLAAAQENTHKLIAARDSYTQYLIAGEDPRFRQLAKKALAKLDAAIPTLTITVSGAASTITLRVDEATAAPGIAIPLDPGSHVIVGLRDGAVVVSKAVTLVDGAREKIELVAPVPQVKRDPGIAKSEGDKVPPPPSGAKSRPIYKRPLFWAIAGGVVLAAGTSYWAIARPESSPTQGTLGTLDTP